MKTKWKVIIGIVIVVALAIAQQPVSQGPQASNAAPWQTNNAQTAGTTTSVGNGTTDSGTQRVTLSSDSTGQIALASGSKANAIPQSTSTYAATAFDLAATAATQVKGSGGNVWGWYGFNPNATTCYLQFYNSTSATLGTSPLHQFGVVAGGSFNMAPGTIALFNLGTGISTGQTTTATGSTQCSSPMVITILYN